MNMTAAELVASKKHILLDFDGPICAAFAGYGAANISRQLAVLLGMEGIDVPAQLFEHVDPFELLRYTATLGDPQLLHDLDQEFRRLELLAVRLAPTTANALAAIRKLRTMGRTVTVVSNNSMEAVEAYSRSHHLATLLTGVSARTSSDPSLLKPNPFLVLRALEQCRASPADALLIGDSLSDLEAGNAAGVPVVAYANKIYKRVALAAGGPVAMITDMAEVVPSR